VWSGCLTQTLVIVQRQPLLLPGDRERAVATAVSTTAAAAVALPPKSKSVVSCLFLPFPYLIYLNSVRNACVLLGGFPSFLWSGIPELPLMRSPFRLSPSSRAIDLV
jgi:hypothetical protein